MLGQVFQTRGKPAIINSDNGPEFIASTVVDWLHGHQVSAAFVAKASPKQDCDVERFNGSMRDKMLNGELFHTLLEARVVISDWITSCNSSRPHRALGMMSRPPSRPACESR